MAKAIYLANRIGYLLTRPKWPMLLLSRLCTYSKFRLISTWLIGPPSKPKSSKITYLEGLHYFVVGYLIVISHVLNNLY